MILACNMKDKEPNKKSEIWLKYCEECVKSGISLSQKDGLAEDLDIAKSDSNNNEDLSRDSDHISTDKN